MVCDQEGELRNYCIDVAEGQISCCFSGQVDCLACSSLHKDYSPP